MNKLAISLLTFALIAGAPAAAQRAGSWSGQRYGGSVVASPPGGWVAPPPVAVRGPMAPPRVAGPVSGGPRWGGKIGGRWWAGMQAPGGWRSYRRPSRGYTLPGYWLSPNFYIADFVNFGLDSPPYGYHWARYYDDAVLVDDGGNVWDSVHGLDWDRLDGRGGGYYQQDYGYAAPETRVERYESSVQGGYGAGYAVPAQPVIVRQPGVTGYTQSYSAGSSYYGSSYYVAPGTTTTVTISAPVITTTTTEVVEETTTYYRPAVRRVVRAAPKRRVVRRRCCDCCCR